MQHPFFEEVDWKQILYGQKADVNIKRDVSSRDDYSDFSASAFVTSSLASKRISDASPGKFNSIQKDYIDGFTFHGDDILSVNYKTQQDPTSPRSLTGH